MSHRHLNSRRVLFALAGLLLINSQLGTKYATAVGGPLAAMLDTVLGPASFIIGGFTQKIRQPPGPLRYDNDRDLAVVIADRDKALVLVEELRSRVQPLEEEVARLKRAREHFDYSGVRIVDARVLSFNDSHTNPILTIDRGSRDGIGPRMSVELDSNLVGIIETVGPRTARLRLLTTEKAFRVRITPADPDAPVYQLEEIIHRRPDRQSYQLDVNRNGPGAVGDYAFLADDTRVFPDESRSRIVGRVSKIEDLPQDPLLKRLVIRPTLPLTRLAKVSVLVPVASDEGGGL